MVYVSSFNAESIQQSDSVEMYLVGKVTVMIILQHYITVTRRKFHSISLRNQCNTIEVQ